MFRISDGKSFSMKFENGVTVRVEFDGDNHNVRAKVNRHVRLDTCFLAFCCGFFRSLAKPSVIRKCEGHKFYRAKVSAWNRGACWITHEFYKDDNDNVHTWISANELVRFLNWAVRRQGTRKTGYD